MTVEQLVRDRADQGQQQRIPGDIDFRCACGLAELEDAFRLVYNAYRRAGLIHPNDDELRISPSQLAPGSQVLIAKYRGNVITTLSVVRSDTTTLPMESIFGGEIHARRRDGLRCVEATCLADRRADMSRAFPVVFRLMCLSLQYSTFHGIDRMLIAVHPRHARFYSRMLGFSVISEERNYPTVRNHPAVALELDLANLELRQPKIHRKIFRHRFTEHQLRHLPMSTDLRRHFQQIHDNINRRQAIEAACSTAELAGLGQCA